MNTQPLLSLRQVNKSFSGGRTVEAVKDVSLGVSVDEMVTLVGPSGCGKTTLLKIGAGLIEPTSGKASLEGIPPSSYRSKNSIGYVSQSAALLPWRTAFKNAALPFEIAGGDTREHADRIHRMFQLLGIDEYANLYPAELSGGIAQRVAVARALLCQAQIVFLDEPFSALDSITRERLWFDASQVFKNEQTATMMVTHNIHEAVVMSDRVLVLTPRPARIVGEVVIDEPRPRRPEFAQTDRAKQLEGKVRKLLFAATKEKGSE